MNGFMQKEWLTIAELQDWLGLGRTKVYELVSDGEIPSYRIGRILRIRRQDLERWLEENRSQPEG